MESLLKFASDMMSVIEIVFFLNDKNVTLHICPCI